MQRGEILTLGLPSPPPWLFRGAGLLLPSGDDSTDIVTAVEERPLIAGFARPDADRRLSGTLLVASERLGEGRVIVFSHDPAYRLFWRGTAPLFLNAVMYAPSDNQ
jgi:hypothetical protein